jgi:hypothetical protein
MEFFDRKQEVIDIKLTQHGKNKLSRGTFKPSYYAFFDNDVIYDTNHGEDGYEEVQKESEDRIKSALRPKAQTITYGLESEITRIIERSEELEDQGLVMKANQTLKNALAFPSKNFNNATLTYPLGTSNLNSFYTPYWNLNSLVGEVKSSSANYTGSLDIERIPQVNVDIFYETFISTGNTDPDPDDDSLAVDSNGNTFMLSSDGVEPSYNDTSQYAPTTYADGSKVLIKRGFSLVDLIEGYTNDQVENFDIEVFLVETQMKNGKERETLKPLRFRDDSYLQLQQSQLFSPELNNSVEINSKYVEYYFEMKFDEEIEDVVRSFAPDIDAVSELPENDFEEPCED